MKEIGSKWKFGGTTWEVTGNGMWRNRLLCPSGVQYLSDDELDRLCGDVEWEEVELHTRNMPAIGDRIHWPSCPGGDPIWGIGHADQDLYLTESGSLFNLETLSATGAKVFRRRELWTREKQEEMESGFNDLLAKSAELIAWKARAVELLNKVRCLGNGDRVPDTEINVFLDREPEGENKSTGPTEDLGYWSRFTRPLP